MRFHPVVLLALAALALAGAAAGAGAKTVVYERELLYSMAATHGFDLVAPAAAFKSLEVKVTLVPGAPCASLRGEVLVVPKAPPPLPDAAILTTFDCDGHGATVVLGAPGLAVYQGRGFPLTLDFAGMGVGRVHVQVLGDPWS